MISRTALLLIVHLIGLCLAAGAASAKLTLLIRYRNDAQFLSSVIRVNETLTRLIAAGMLLLVLSGVVWLLLGYPFSARLWLKLGLVVLMPVSGFLISRMEHRRAFASVQYLALEISATVLFYLVIIIWVLR